MPDLPEDNEVYTFNESIDKISVPKKSEKSVANIKKMLLSCNMEDDIAQQIAEYLFSEKNCVLGEDPILFVHCLPELHTKVSDI